MDKVKMFLFARWLATCYADTHADDKLKSQHDEGFNSSEAMSILNRESGQWYKEQLDHFIKVVYPNYVKNGTVKNAEDFLNK